MITPANRLRAGFALAFLLLLLNILAPLLFGRWIESAIAENEAQLRISGDVQQLLSALKDGETGQRGYILTGRDDFLSPLYQGFADVDRLQQRLEQSIPANDALRESLALLKPTIERQRNYFETTIAIRREQGLTAASSVVTEGRGKQLMDNMRGVFAGMLAELDGRIGVQSEEIRWRELATLLSISLIGLLDLLLLVALFFYTFRIMRGMQLSEQHLTELGERSAEGMARLEQRNRDISLLSRMAGALHSTNDLKESFRIIDRFAMQLFPRDSGRVALYHPSHDVLEVVARWGLWRDSEQTFFEPDACWAIRRGQSHLVDDPGSDLICPHLENDPTIDQGYLCVPLMAQGSPLGALTLTGASRPDRQLAEAFAEQVSLGISNLSLRDSLRQQSVVDALTGLHNRRFLDESLKREVLRAVRQQSSLMVALLDVDHFKRFNDTFGHEAGDLVLRQLALEIQRQVRGSDLACRYGGEEFALVLPDIGVDDALIRCEALRSAVARLQVRYGGQALGPITISIGLAFFPEDGQQPEALLQAADAALYHAKESGRDRVCRSRRGIADG